MKNIISFLGFEKLVEAAHDSFYTVIDETRLRSKAGDLLDIRDDRWKQLNSLFKAMGYWSDSDHDRCPHCGYEDQDGLECPACDGTGARILRQAVAAAEPGDDCARCEGSGLVNCPAFTVIREVSLRYPRSQGSVRTDSIRLKVYVNISSIDDDYWQLVVEVYSTMGRPKTSITANMGELTLTRTTTTVNRQINLLCDDWTGLETAIRDVVMRLGSRENEIRELCLTDSVNKPEVEAAVERWMDLTPPA